LLEGATKGGEGGEAGGPPPAFTAFTTFFPVVAEKCQVGCGGLAVDPSAFFCRPFFAIDSRTRND